MAYCTQADLEDRYGERELIERTDRDNVPPTTVDTDVLDKAIADADAEINARLAVRYDVPLASPPLVLTRWACSITRFFLYQDLPRENPIVQEYERVLKSLDQVAAGKLDLGPDADGDEPATTDAVQFSSDARDFARVEAGW